MASFKFNPKILHPANCVVSSATMGGKSHWIKRLLFKKLIDPWPTQIKYIYFYDSPDFESLKTIPGIEFLKGIPENLCDEDFLDQQFPSLIILDDVMTSLNKDVLNLFTRGCHHLNRSVILTVQNIFYQNPVMRTISLNAHYLVIFKSPRDLLQLEMLGRQMFPSAAKQFMTAYKYAVSRDYGYLFIDLKTLTPDELRIRTTVLEETEDKLQRVLIISDTKMDTFVLVPTSQMFGVKSSITPRPSTSSSDKPSNKKPSGATNLEKQSSMDCSPCRKKRKRRFLKLTKKSRKIKAPKRTKKR
jgi:hypothetical protein